MNWLNPWAAWFLLLIPAVVALYFLRLRREDVAVSSTLLWSRVLEERRVNAPFQRLRKNLLLLLQILAILILVGALARPETESESLAGLTHILLVDVSASMDADEGGKSRLELAQELATDYVRGIGKGERAVVIRFARGAKAVSPVTADRDLLEEAIASLTAHPSPANVDAGMELALSIARNQIDALAVIISDGGFPAWESGEIPLPIQFIPVGETGENSGIVALSSRLDLSGSGRPQVFVEVRNYGEFDVGGELSILQGGELIRADNPKIEAGKRWSGSFDVLGEGLLEVLWDPRSEDALRLDNAAWVQLEARRDLRLWRVGGKNYFLDEALQALPQVAVELIAADEVEGRIQRGERPPDVLLWDRFAPAVLPRAPGQFFFGAVPPGVWEETSVAQFPEIIAWDRSHPVNRFIVYSKIEAIEESIVFPPAPGATVLVDTRGGGLISAFTVPGVRGVAVGFDVLRSDWPLRIGFPLFLYNAIQFLAGSDAGGDVGVRGGELLKLKAEAGVSSFEIVRPDGEVVELKADADGWLRYVETDELGPYTIRSKLRDFPDEPPERVVPVNLLSPRESNLTPRESLVVGGSTVAGNVGAIAPARREYWSWILAAALTLLLAEWYYFHRR